MANPDTVIVACKLPHGLVIEARQVDFIDGPNNERRGVHQVIGTAKLRGSAEARKLESEGKILGEVGHVVDGYGLTEVDKELFELWLDQNKNSPLVKNHIIFATLKMDAAKSQAREQGPEIKNGLEPVDPAKPGAGVEPVPEKELPKAA